MTETEILRQIVQKQDEYHAYLLKLLKTCNVLWDISIGAREDQEEELASLRQQLEECKGKHENSESIQAWICPRCGKVHSWLSMTCDCLPTGTFSTTY